MERAVLVCRSGTILLGDLDEMNDSGLSFERTLCTLKENDEIHTAYVLSSTDGDRKEAADILGVSLRQVQRKIAKMKENPRWKSILKE